MINFNSIIEPIQAALIHWIQHSPHHLHIAQLQDLNDGHFFVYMLKRVEGFRFEDEGRWVEGLQRQVFGLSQKIKRMKWIGSSLIKHYRSQLKMDIGQIRFNYIEICTNNKEQLIRFFIYFMGVIVHQKDIRSQIQAYIHSNNGKNSNFLQTMLDYALNIDEGHKQTIPSDSPIKKQRKLISQLQVLQQQIQFYEQFTKELEESMENVKQQRNKQRKKVRDSQAEKGQILKRVEELQQANEAVIAQLSKKQSKEQVLNAKIANNSLAAEQMINKLLKQMEAVREECHYHQNQRFKNQHAASMNLQLQRINEEYDRENQTLRKRITKLNENLAVKDQRIQKVEQQGQLLLIQNNALKTRIQLIEKSFILNKEYPNLSFNTSFTNPHQLSLPHQYNSEDQQHWLNQHNNHEQINPRNDSLTMTIRSGSSYSAHHHKLNNTAHKQQDKENNMNSLNIFPQNNGSNKQIGGFEKRGQFLGNLRQEDSIEICLSQVQELKRDSYRSKCELQLSMQMLLDLYGHYDSVRKELNKYRLNESRQAQRKSIFMQKVNTMFD